MHSRHDKLHKQVRGEEIGRAAGREEPGARETIARISVAAVRSVWLAGDGFQDAPGGRRRVTCHFR